MSTSVVLEGQVESSPDSCSWSGIWRFAKDKKGAHQFQYEKVSYEVPPDLLDYVSFLDPVSVAQSLHNKTDSFLFKNKRGRRGRPVANGGETKAIDSTSAQPTGDHASLNPPDDSRTAESGASTEQLSAPEHDTLINGLDKHNQATEASIGASEEAQAGTANDCEASGSSSHGHHEADCGESPEPSEPAIISPTHPLLGLWKGKFAVHSAKGEEYVEESFFFHSLLGAEALPQFSKLPPEPSFPFCLLKHHHLQSGLNGILESIGRSTAGSAATACATTETGEAGRSGGDGNAEANPTLTSSKPNESNGEREASQGLEHSVEATEQPPATSSQPFSTGLADTTTAPPADDDPEVKIEEGTLDPSPATANALETLYKHVLIGFGRNAIGRFSVAALYDEAQHELRCEKKYMTTKFSVKRGRRSHAEYALSYGYNNNGNSSSSSSSGGGGSSSSSSGGGGGGGGGSQTAYTPMTTRQSDNSTAAEESGRSLRHVSHPNYSINHTYKTSYTEEGGTDSLPSAKRKRSNSTRGEVGTTLSSRPSKQDLVQSQADPYADHPLALVGSRNPDNDHVTEGFREAFMDVDSGEIYEGQWAFGLRHGYGVCLYSDGLLYEGQWLRGKEHGKGMLMTGDRQLIYSGDWLDGQMHGSGEYHYCNGDVYIGDFKEASRHGRGEYQSLATNCRYMGDWKDGKRHGKGRFVWGDGQSFYEGDWDQDLRSGRGVLELASGFKYDGMWSHNVMEGKGTCTYAPSGQTYQGTFRAGLRDGRGSIFFSEGDAVYEGRFKEDRFDGQGTIKIANTVEGTSKEEVFVPIQIQPDFWRIHWKAGFGSNAH